MGAFIVVVAAVTSAVPAFHGSAATSPSPPSLLSRLETLVFRTSLETFMSVSRSRSGNDASFDWTTDRCSAPLVGDTGRSFDFTAACTRHDFAYRNYKKVDAASAPHSRVWTSSMRHRVDLVFRQDMRNHCSRRPAIDRAPCHMWAELFFRLVRLAGGP